VLNISLSVLDLILDQEKKLANYEVDFIFYTGLSVFNIPLQQKFNYLYDFKDPEKIIRGQFKVEYIQVLMEECDHIPKGYNALIGIKTDVTLEDLKKNLPFKEDGNLMNVCRFSMEPPA
jgi:hypothetical protein